MGRAIGRGWQGVSGGGGIDEIFRLYLNGKDPGSNWSAGGQIKSASNS